jgi:DNA polymerase III subunit alpha
MKSPIWNLHTHSKHSTNDALPTVERIVSTVAGYNQPAIGLTDHGNMSGAVQLYKHATKAGMAPFPGSELYVVHDRNDKKAKRHHMCVVAYTTQGYQNLVRLSTLSYQNFYHKPILDHSDLASLSEAGGLKGIAATSGCYFGFIAQAIVRNDPETARQLMTTYDKWFDRFYVELQNHNIDHGDGWNDDSLASEIYTHAYSLGIPAVLTQDSHYCEHNEQETHNALKRLVAFGDDPDDAVFPGDGFGLATEEWFKSHHPADRFAYGQSGLADLLAANTLVIEQLDKYHYNIPFTVADPDRDITLMCNRAMDDMRLNHEKKYAERYKEELAVIRDTGMAGYILMVKEVTDECRKRQIFYQARGSASGSLVCYLLGITQHDPVKFGLSFERFISRDRTKPPDIDLDVESARRKELIEWAQTKYAVAQIGTFSEYSMSGDEEDEGSKGSVLVKYYAGNRRRGTGALRWEDVPTEDRLALHEIADQQPFASYGTHAAGLVVTTSDSDLNKLVPLMLVASSNTWVTQYEGDDIESLGLVKLDALGVKTLDVLHRCMENLGRDVFQGLGWIPLSDSATYRRLAKGDTEGVFQLEGPASKQGCRRLRPTTIKDIIAAMALFRPATMNSGATETYIRRKHGEESNPPRNPMLDAQTKATYGILLFQEQVIAILRQLGMDADNLTKFLKSVKASNSNIGDAGKVIDGYKDMVWAMAVDADFSKRDWEWFWDSATGFAAYGFNEAHSTAYGITAYRCGYLATHHPVEFFAAVLAVAAGSAKEAAYLSAVRSYGLKIRRADVNYSSVTYGVDTRKDSIRKGLMAIKGIGAPTAKKLVENRPDGGYKSVEELCRLSKVSGSGPYLHEGDKTVGVVGKLFECGALDSLEER